MLREVTVEPGLLQLEQGAHALRDGSVDLSPLRGGKCLDPLRATNARRLLGANDTVGALEDLASDRRREDADARSRRPQRLLEMETKVPLLLRRARLQPPRHLSVGQGSFVHESRLLAGLSTTRISSVR